MKKNKRMRIITTLFFTLFLGHWMLAQTLRGIVRNQESGTPLKEVKVVFTAFNNRSFSTLSDENGAFRLDTLPIGTGTLQVTVTGFVPFVLREVVIAAGKDRIVNVLLTEGIWQSDMSPVEIVEPGHIRQVAPLGEIPLTREQTLYNPMTYFDPARLAAAYPGVAQTDDGTNSMSIRGNNPGLVRWRLNGMDIVSPNHLPNAGTLTDQPTSSSGGVMMLSAQMLDNSSLITGAGLAGYNDGIGGIMDLNLRKGNTERHEQTLQFGLIGLDAAIEGPLSKRKRGSYLINYRYSFTGLLGAMGVSFGGEKITFQDVAAHFYWPGKKQNSWSAYIIGGQSSNYYTPPDSATIFKEQFNIDFESRSVITGLQFSGYAGKNFSSKTGISFSFQSNDRTQVQPSISFESNLVEEGRLVFSSSNRLKISPNTTLLAGTNISTQTFYNFRRETAPMTFAQTDGNFTIQLWLGGETTLKDGQIKVHYGLTPLVTSYGSSLDPRIQVSWRIADPHQLIFSTAAYSQSLPLWMQRTDGISLLRSSINAVKYNYQPNHKWLLSSEFFFQGISNIAVNDDDSDAYSFVNQNEYPRRFEDYITDGSAQNVGLELSAQRRLGNGWFMNNGLTLLRSTYRGSDKVERRTRWDVGQIANVTAGKEWHRRLKRNLSGRIFGVSGRATYMGGYRAAPVDVTASAQEQATIYDLSNGYTERTPAYYRLDGRVYWKRSIGKKRNSTLALEFQNLTGRKNIAYQYYDPLTKVVTTKYQLGTIPNLSWRVEL
jgi:hypothetical protein